MDDTERDLVDHELDDRDLADRMLGPTLLGGTASHLTEPIRYRDLNYGWFGVEHHCGA